MVLQQAAALGMRTRMLEVPGAWRDTEVWLLACYRRSVARRKGWGRGRG